MPTPVRGAGPPLDEPAVGETVEEARHAALRQEDALGELRRPQSLGRSIREREQDVVVRRIELRALEGRLRQAGRGAERADEGLPGPDLLRRRRGRSARGIGCTRNEFRHVVDHTTTVGDGAAGRTARKKGRQRQMQWQIDPTHSSLTFGVRHMMVATVKGSVGGLAGTLDLDPEQPEIASIEVVADPATITTGEARRDGHLRSADFFDAENHPEIRFRSTRIVRTDDDEVEVHGDLTIRGITKPIVAEAEIDGIWDDPKMGKRAGLSAKATIDRRDWGLVWNQPVANGGVLVGEKVKIELGLSAVLAEAATKAA